VDEDGEEPVHRCLQVLSGSSNTSEDEARLLHDPISDRTRPSDIGSLPVWVLGDLDGILQTSRDLLGEGHDEVPVECFGDAGEGVETVAGAAAFLQAGDD
jgi:hypothetical protein